MSNKNINTDNLEAYRQKIVGMKKNIRVIILVLGLSVLCHGNAAAGTFILGVKYWHADWDSAILDWFEKDISLSFQENRLQLKAESDPGQGYLYGPLLGYQTDNGKWTFSFAPMVFSSFDQDWDGSAGTMDIEAEVNLERKDYDFMIGYNLSKYIKGYLGYKYQEMEMDFDLSYITLTSGEITFNYNVESRVHMPSVGVGGFYPMHEKVVAGLQLGLIYSIPDLKISEDSTGTDNIKPWPNLGFNTECTLTYQPLSNFILQLGYRYQVFTMEARGPGREDITESYDITQGWTFSAVYAF